ncbi:diaminopimelate epimerase [Paludicola sp. MB14-C6]|uniref:diaminopimelate epimerase n=1 Tax=Paludihabitans sp. MB14-C6 TaxID=3070656 RepID=UPI0027DC7E6D|nr:diaminopimelate epimerase [Paludicola sp. MB14-C6]WMJ23220.1 diaminopimelate epimerase [Paludicola sp. MB14-C6]
MELKFTKMQGCGNDYIYINCIENAATNNMKINSPESLSVLLSDRHFGVGGDGIVLILSSDIADAKMRMFNIDGSEGKMCGNAIRCVAKYLYDNNIVNKETLTVETLAGVKKLFLTIQNGAVSSVKVNMGNAELSPDKIPVKMQGDSIVNRQVNINNIDYAITCVSMGNPHAVVFCDDVDYINLAEIGPLFENNSLFPERINTEFVEIVDENNFKMRVWERGSGETLACGTGACASAVAAVLNGYCDKNTDIKVQLLGGDLVIRYTDDAVYMTGGCKKVFDGVIEI